MKKPPSLDSTDVQINLYIPCDVLLCITPQTPFQILFILLFLVMTTIYWLVILIFMLTILLVVLHMNFLIICEYFNLNSKCPTYYQGHLGPFIYQYLNFNQHVKGLVQSCPLQIRNSMQDKPRLPKNSPYFLLPGLLQLITDLPHNAAVACLQLLQNMQ